MSAEMADLGLPVVSLYTLPIILVLEIASSIGFSRALSRRLKLEVGTDGLVLRAKRHPAFIRYADIERVSVEERKVHERVSHELGHILRLRCRDGERLVAGPFERLQRIEQAIASARGARRRRSGSIDTSNIDRGDRSAREWVQHLRAQGKASQVNYRTAPPNRDHLWSVVEADRDPPALRGAAAIALGRLDRLEQERLTETARQTANPRLRTLFAHCLGKRSLSVSRVGKMLTSMETEAQRVAIAANAGARAADPWYLRHEGKRR